MLLKSNCSLAVRIADKTNKSYILLELVSEFFKISIELVNMCAGIAHIVEDPTATISFHMPQITCNSFHQNLINIAQLLLARHN